MKYRGYSTNYDENVNLKQILIKRKIPYYVKRRGVEIHWYW